MILRCLSKLPEERFQTDEELLQALTDATDSAPRLSKKKKRKALPAFLGFSVCIVLVASTAAFIAKQNEKTSPRANKDAFAKRYASEIKAALPPALSNPSENVKVLDRWLAYHLQHPDKTHTPTHIDEDSEQLLINAELDEVSSRAKIFDEGIPPYAAEVKALLQDSLKRLSAIHDDSGKHQSKLSRYRASVALLQLINGEDSEARSSLIMAIGKLSSNDFERFDVQHIVFQMSQVQSVRGKYEEAIEYLRMMPAIMQYNGVLLPQQTQSIESMYYERLVRLQSGQEAESQDELSKRLIAFMDKMPADIGRGADLSKVVFYLNALQHHKDVIALIKKYYPRQIFCSDIEIEISLEESLSSAYLQTHDFAAAEPLLAHIMEHNFDIGYAPGFVASADTYLLALKSQGKNSQEKLDSLLARVKESKSTDFYLETLLGLKERCQYLGQPTVEKLRKMVLACVPEYKGKCSLLCGRILFYESANLFVERKYTECVKVSEQCLELLPEAPGSYLFVEILYSTLLREFLSYVQIKEYEQAENVYKRILAIKGLDPGFDYDADAIYARYISSKNLNEAIKIDSALVKRFDNHPVQYCKSYFKVVCDLAEFLDRKGQTADAIALLKKGHEKLVRDCSDAPSEIGYVVAMQDGLRKKNANPKK